MKKFEYGELIYYKCWCHEIKNYEIKFGIAIRTYISENGSRNVEVISDNGLLIQSPHLLCYKIFRKENERRRLN